MAGTRKLMSKTVRVKKDDTLEKYSLFKGEQKRRECPKLNLIYHLLY